MIKKKVLALLLITLDIVFCQSTKNSPNYRLPHKIKPIHYDVVLEPHLEDGKNTLPLNGSVLLMFKVLEDTTNITLDVKQLDIDTTSITVVGENGNVNVASISYEVDCESEFLLVKTQNDLTKNMLYNLSIPHFNGTLKTDNGGFYIAKYIDENGKERSFVTTQFSATNARKAFPCMDEPALKATFSISLIRTDDYISLSNEVQVDTKVLGNGRFQDIYATTVKMSTYLLAFVITPFRFVLSENQRVFARPAAINEGLADYALSTGIQLIDLFSNYFSLNYTLDKLDQVGVPDTYFAAGAMENWGLVIYKENSLLYSNYTSTAVEKQRATTIIAHELSHQWFGNLVTLQHWRYLWLNEGFARYFEYIAAGWLFPQWGMEDLLVVKVMQYSFIWDSLNTTESINYKTTCPVGWSPSYIVYDKAAAVIRMMKYFLNEKAFQNGLSSYLIDNQFGSTEPKHFYDAIEKYSDLNIGYSIEEIMSTWADQKGYPVVTCAFDKSTGEMFLKQERFMLKDQAFNTSIWYIPINFAVQSNINNFNNTAPQYWLTTEQAVINNITLTNGWYIANIQQTGYYRVNYDQENWYNLINYLLNDDFKNIHILNRAQLIDDSFNLARSGRLEYDIPLKIGKYLQNESEYIPLYAFFTGISFVKRMLINENEYALLQHYILNNLQTAINNLGYEPKNDDSHFDKINRGVIVNWLCELDDLPCKEKTLKIFKENEIIHPDLQYSIYCGAMRSGSNDDWNVLLNKLYEITKENMQERILNALGCSLNESILNGYFELIFSNDTLIRNDMKLVSFKSIYTSSNVGLQNALNYLQVNALNANTILPMKTVLDEMAERSTTVLQLNQLKNILHQLESSIGKYNIPIQIVEENIEWINSNAQKIFDALQE